MTNQKHGSWVEYPHAVASLIAEAVDKDVPIGGRFVCEEDADVDPMAGYMVAEGLSVRDTGQCELVATRTVGVSYAAVKAVMDELRRISFESGYRLESIEAGDFEAGKARVLASEEGYVPWWEWKVED